MALKELLLGKETPKEIGGSLALVDVPYFSFEGKIDTGKMIVHKELAEEIMEIFKLVANEKFPIAKIKLISCYGWSDEKSMEDNNTSCFNYRKISGTDHLSNHSYGMAIDINPMFNPFISKNGSAHPKNSHYNPKIAGTITQNSPVVRIFEKFGWKWGGRWENPKDWQHFEKIRPPVEILLC